MDHRPFLLMLGSATLGYVAWSQRRVSPLRADGDVEQTDADTYRNRGLRFRAVGGPSEPYPAWVRALKGHSGVYVIRELDANGEPTVVYVGESHTDRLYDTLTRHLQQWRRWKGFWRGQYGEGHDPGLTYDRATVDVAARVVPPDEALDLEARLIRRYAPRDNIRGQTTVIHDDDAAPF